ncbi:MAG: segregation/condensation protein A [Deltaproteobacteria bacterium]|nr:segregation/condensation protein A [Deltaproteobacteria bacterium]
MFYNIKLDIFEGPLDLLLHLIKKNEVDIYDIPVAVITEQYLQYIELMKEMNLDFAGEFLVMAASLVHIKSKMLLPVDEEAPEEEEEGADPREELVRRLLEYQRYKEAAKELGERVVLGRDVFPRGSEIPVEELEEGAGFMSVSVFDLMEALKDVLAKAPKERKIELTSERFKIADKINDIMEHLNTLKSSTFTALFAEGSTKGEIVVTFLAILELAKLTMIKIHQTDDGVIRVYLPAPQENAEQEQAAELAAEPTTTESENNG